VAERVRQWWADPLAGYVLIFYAAREAWHILREEH
jgi:hypothetical protein